MADKDPIAPGLIEQAMAHEEYHLFQIPVEGFFHLYHRTEMIHADYIKLVLAEADGTQAQTPVRVEAKTEENECVVWFAPDPDLPENSRAREIVADVFGWHMVFHGCVLIDGMEAETVADLIRRYG